MLRLSDITLYAYTLVCVVYINVYTYINVSGSSGFPGGSVVKNLPDNAGDLGLIPGLGRSPGDGNANTLQYSCRGNPMKRGDWWAIVHGVAKESDTT